MANDTKRCSRCKRILPLACFNKNVNRADGYQYNCRDCTKALHVAYRNTHQEQIAAKRKEWREKNAEKMREYKREYKRSHPEKARAYSKAYRDRINAQQKTSQSFRVESTSHQQQFHSLGRRFVRPARKPTVEQLKNLDDQQLLGVLLEIPDLTGYVKFLQKEAAHRPAIYQEIMHLVIQNDPEHQRMMKYR